MGNDEAPLRMDPVVMGNPQPEAPRVQLEAPATAPEAFDPPFTLLGVMGLRIPGTAQRPVLQAVERNVQLVALLAAEQQGRWRLLAQRAAEAMAWHFSAVKLCETPDAKQQVDGWHIVYARAAARVGHELAEVGGEA